MWLSSEELRCPGLGALRSVELADGRLLTGSSPLDPTGNHLTAFLYMIKAEVPKCTLSARPGNIACCDQHAYHTTLPG